MDRDSTPEALVASFHRAKSLIPNDQELITIPPEMSVSEAFKLMQKHRFSQLPVVAGDAVLGVFSYRSFSTKALARQNSTREPLGNLPVEDFLEDFEYAYANDDWNQVLRYLNQDDACFVGHRDGMEGMITPMDMLRYFREIAIPFITIAEIELSLRQIIQTCVEAGALPDALNKSLRTAYENREIPTHLNKMTFDNYVQIISNGENWPHFEKMFGSDDRTRRQTCHKLKQLGDWRNIIFHFRRRLEDRELEALAEHREWLHRRVRAFEGRRRKATEEVTLKPGKINRQKVLATSSPSAKEFFDWMLSQAEARQFKIYWGIKGFSIRKQLPQGIISFVYGYPPQTFEFYFGHLALDEAEELEWRRDLLSFGVLEEAGERTLRTYITENNVAALRELYSHIVDKVEAYAHD
jgi:hypothetical protein